MKINKKKGFSRRNKKKKKRIKIAASNASNAAVNIGSSGIFLDRYFSVLLYNFHF